MSSHVEGPHPQRDGLLPPPRLAKDGRSMSSASAPFSTRLFNIMQSAPPPGSFSSDIKSMGTLRGETPRPEFSHRASFGYGDQDDGTSSEQRQAEFRERLDKETKIKIGSENLLEALNSKNAKQSRDQRLRVESELHSTNKKIAQLKLDLEAEIQRSKTSESSPKGRLSHLFRNADQRSPTRQATSPTEAFPEPTSESPTFMLAEILQALEVEGMQQDYYVGHANDLVELFKRHSTLKYDLAWSIFGLRMQTLLLSHSREVIAAGYRVMRYAITDRKSLQTIRRLQTDHLVTVSLVKESKASVEREQALKFVRAFLDVKDGIQEISRGVIRTIVAVAEHNDDRLRNMCILTLAEMMVHDPSILIAAGGIGVLSEALGDANYHASESLAIAFLYLLDTPSRRQYLRSGLELTTPFAAFSDSSSGQITEAKLKANAKVIAVLLKSWPGLSVLSMNDFIAIRSLMSSLCFPIPAARHVILELLFDALRIKSPSWSSSFLAGRRLTTYGRVTNLKSESFLKDKAANSRDDSNRINLVEHYTAVVLAVLIHAGLLNALLTTLKEEESDSTLRRKSVLLLGEVLELSRRMLPSEWSSRMQVLPDLFVTAAKFGFDDRFVATGTIYQVDSVNRTLYRSTPTVRNQSQRSRVDGGDAADTPPSEQPKPALAANMDEGQFRASLLETQVLNTVNFTKWNWDLILGIVEGPLTNGKRLDEAMKVTKFVKRLIGFFRPFKYRFSEVKNTKPNQRYVRTGCALVRTLLQNTEGVKYLAENKLLRQIAECLAQVDRMSGLTSASPLFSRERLTETLTGGYFAILGTLSSDPKGLAMIERWKMINMFYHIIELRGRDDLIKILLGHMDYTIDSHLRVMLSKALTACSKGIRIFSTKLLRRHATSPVQSSATSTSSLAGDAEWAIRLLITQLYDPDVEVCGAAVKVLEDACNQRGALEFVVKCRPVLDHLGEIGAPLLLRFLSTSVGYHYLDGLDYITQEMDDWFLGRNDTYVSQIEASLARALIEAPEKTRQTVEDGPESYRAGDVPPHFYRELTRTEEGCKLLMQKGHFDEFVAVIKEHGMESEDGETMLKVKGCLWAVGNVGSMDLGAPFLEQSDITNWIVDIAEKSEAMSMRGTAFFVLGLISRSLHGQEILAQHGWDGTVNAMGESLGFCIPLDFKKSFSIRPWRHVAGPGQRTSISASNRVVMTDDDPVNARILSLVVDLGNTVLTKRAASDLHSIKAKRALGFQQPELFRKVMTILESHHYRLPARRFIIDLFDKDVMRRIVLEEDEYDVDNAEHR